MTDKGNGKDNKLQLKNANATILVDDATRQALAKDDSLSEVNEPTKYILLDNALVESVFDDRVKHFTKYLNREEVLQMNDIEAHAKLIPLVFKSKYEAVNKKILGIADLFNKHAHDHMDNMMALDSKGGNTAKLLVMALKADNNPYPTDKEMKKMFGGR
jgi:hypothetical protein